MKTKFNKVHKIVTDIYWSREKDTIIASCFRLCVKVVIVQFLSQDC